MKHVSPEDAAKVIFTKMRGSSWKGGMVKSEDRGHVLVSPETAQSALGSSTSDVVIAVPFEFAAAQKKAVRYDGRPDGAIPRPPAVPVQLSLSLLHRDAAEAAGFHVLRLIHEPAAALLAYDIGQSSSCGRR